jgi:hypothetical protein
MLIIGGNQAKVDGIQTEIMANGKLYNVRQNTWHTVLLSQDASILIIENQDISLSRKTWNSLPTPGSGKGGGQSGPDRYSPP